MAQTRPSLLPVNGSSLTSDARVLDAVRRIGARNGIDYTDDTAVTAMLAERRRAVEAEQRQPAAWLGMLAVTAAILLPVMAPMVPALDANPFAVVALPGPLLIIGVALVVHARTRWKRALQHDTLAGYREVLGVARAHGIPLTHVPAWLEGRSSSGGGGKGAAPIPSYPPVEPVPAAERHTQQDPRKQPVPVPVPPKPAAVTAYEQSVDEGGWHDEAGCLLLFAGAFGALWAATSDEPIGYGALVLVPLALYVWLMGNRQGREKARLREQALAYVRAVAAAQAAGAQVPELSPVLRKLLDENP